MNDLISRQAVLDIVLADPGIEVDRLEMIEKLPSVNTDGDLISRKMAIDSIQYAGKIGKQTCISILKRLPSIQSEITRCGKCTHKDKKIDYCHYLGITICESDYCSYAVRRTDE